MESKVNKLKTAAKSPEKVKGDEEAIATDSDSDSDDYELEVDDPEEESGSQYETETETQTTESEDSVDLDLGRLVILMRYHICSFVYNHQNILLIITTCMSLYAAFDYFIVNLYNVKIC